MDKFEKYRYLLKEAIGNRTLAQFSEETGITVESLSRIQTGANTSRPRIGTLEKIADNSKQKVDIKELLSLFDYDYKDYLSLKEEKKNNTPDHERARNEIQMLLKGFNEFKNIKWDGLSELLDTVYMLYTEEKPKFTIGEELPCNKKIDHNAESMVLVTGNARLSGSVANIYILLTYNETKNGAIILSNATSNTGILKSAKVLNKNFDVPGVSDDVEETFELYPVKGMSEQEMDNIRKSISCITGQQKYIHTITGIGFIVSDRPDRKTVDVFYKNHKKSISELDAKEIKRYLSGDSEALDDVGDRITGAFGWGGLVANIISEETGLQARFWTQEDELDEFKFDDNPSCILVPDEEAERQNLSADKIMDTLEPYAREIGAKEIGCCYFSAVFDKTDREKRILR